MIQPQEIWHIDVNGEIYEAEFAELAEWISQSSLHATDKVRRGNLRWLEAGKVPALKEFFDAKENGTDPPYVESPATVDVESESPVSDETSEADDSDEEVNPLEIIEHELPGKNVFTSAAAITGALNSKTCIVHPKAAPKFYCEACTNAFCSECPNKVGKYVRTCPYCGDSCFDIDEYQAQIEKKERYNADLSAGFGFGDFGKALGYPFRFKTSLMLGGFIFAFFSIGQGAATLGGLFLVAAALICFMFASALVFGVLAKTIDNFSKGHTNQNFMPDFEDFSLWDDIVHPCLLSIAVYVSSFGIFLTLVFGGIWYSWNSIAGGMSGPVQKKFAIDLDNVSDQTRSRIRELIVKYRQINIGRSDIEVGPDGLTDGQRNSIQEETEMLGMNDLVNNYRKSQLESTIGKTAETEQKEFRAMASQFLELPGLYLFLVAGALLWGAFYFPAACAVAGYTQSFRSTVNPALGIDTIKHLGSDYSKILLMFLILSVMSGVIAGTLELILSPFNLPRMGNLPATFVGSFVTFYFSVTLAVVLGFALYKNSDKLNLRRG